eukprot:g20781.t1
MPFLASNSQTHKRLWVALLNLGSLTCKKRNKGEGDSLEMTEMLLQFCPRVLSLLCSREICSFQSRIPKFVFCDDLEINLWYNCACWQLASKASFEVNRRKQT